MSDENNPEIQQSQNYHDLIRQEMLNQQNHEEASRESIILSASELNNDFNNYEATIVEPSLPTSIQPQAVQQHLPGQLESLFSCDHLSKPNELCSEHQLRKTLICQQCRRFICDKCLITSHFQHRHANLSKIAYDIKNLFCTSLESLSGNLEHINHTRPQDWKRRLRSQLLDFFDSISSKIETIK